MRHKIIELVFKMLRSFCVYLSGKTKENYFTNLDHRIAKPFFPNKVKTSIAFNLVEKANIIDNDKDITLCLTAV